LAAASAHSATHRTRTYKPSAARAPELLTDIDRTERALDEADRVLDGTAFEVAAIAS
jgi:hypothetical protein